MRCALESLAARDLSARAARDASVAALRAAVEEMVRREKRSVDDRIEADLCFDRTLVRLTGNDTLCTPGPPSRGSIRISINWAGLERAVANMNARRHIKIVDAIESGDPSLVSETVAEHMGAAAEMLVSGAA